MYSPKGGILSPKNSRISILIVPEEGWFCQLKCSTEIMPTPRSDGSCFQKRCLFHALSLLERKVWSFQPESELDVKEKILKPNWGGQSRLLSFFEKKFEHTGLTCLNGSDHSLPQSLRFFWSRGRRNGGFW